MLLNVDRCAPNGTYIIIEQVHPMTGAPTGLRPRPGLTQVYRKVFQVCELQGDYYFDGKPIAGQPNAWHYIRELMSRQDRLTTTPTGELGWIRAYAGFKNVATPLPPIRDKLPEMVTRERDFGTPPTPFVFGTDPIPHVQLYGRMDIRFVAFGGRGAPTALVIYDGEDGSLKEVQDPLERQRIMGEFVEAAALH